MMKEGAGTFLSHSPLRMYSRSAENRMRGPVAASV